jgi:hypothetical protein
MSGIEPFLRPAATAGGKRVAKWAAQKILGPRDERALNRIRNNAIREAVRSTFENRSDDLLESHTVALLERALPSGAELAELDILTSTGRTEIAADLLHALRSAPSLDVDAMGVDFIELISSFLLFFMSGLRTDAQRVDSTLHQMVTEQELTALSQNLEAVIEAVNALPTATTDLEYVRVLAHAGWANTLRGFYPTYPLLHIFDADWPAAIRIASPDEWSNLETPLGSLLDDEIPPHDEYPTDCFPTARKEFARLLEQTKTNERLWSGPTYALDTVRIQGRRMHLDCRMGRYLPMKVTCDSLEAELLSELRASPEESVDLKKLPRRSWAHDHCSNGDPIVSGHGRSAAVSVATTILMAKGGGKFSVILSPRSGEVAAHPFFNHVMPSGILAPLEWNDAELRAEFSVKQTMLREYSEELFDNEAWQYGDTPHIDIHSEPEVQRLLEEQEAGNLDIYYTGLTFNLFSLRPEICTMILIRDPDWYSRETVRARELAGPSSLAGSTYRSVKSINCHPIGNTCYFRTRQRIQSLHVRRECRRSTRWIGRKRCSIDGPRLPRRPPSPVAPRVCWLGRLTISQASSNAVGLVSSSGAAHQTALLLPPCRCERTAALAFARWAWLSSRLGLKQRGHSAPQPPEEREGPQAQGRFTPRSVSRCDLRTRFGTCGHPSSGWRLDD